MKSLLIVLATVIAALCGPARAQLVINELNGFNGANETRRPIVTFLGCSGSAASGTNPYTISSVDVGLPDSTRTTVVALLTEDDAATYTGSTLTVGGDSATKLVDQGAVSSNASASIWSLSNPNGTSEDIVATLSEAMASNVAACVWSVTGLTAPTTAVDTATDVRSSANISVVIDVDTYGVLFAACSDIGPATTHTWSGVTQRFDGAVGGGASSANVGDYSSGSAAFEANRAVSDTRSVSSSRSCSFVSLK